MIRHSEVGSGTCTQRLLLGMPKVPGGAMLTWRSLLWRFIAKPPVCYIEGNRRDGAAQCTFEMWKLQGVAPRSAPANPIRSMTPYGSAGHFTSIRWANRDFRA